MGFRERIASAVARLDGWVNTITGVGVRDGRAGFGFEPEALLPYATLEAIFHGDPFARRVCEAVPKHALRRGFEVKVADKATSGAIAAALASLKASAALQRAWTWGHVDGGGAVLLGLDDGLDPSLPVDESALRAVRFVTDVTAESLFAEQWDTDPLSATFGEPVLYRLTRTGGGGGTDFRAIHRTRLIRFEGLPTTPKRRITLRSWGESYLAAVLSLLREWEGAHAAVGDLLQQSSVPVIALRDLMSMIASDEGGLLKKRLEAMDLARSVAKAVLIDADGERFERTEVGALSGLPELLDRYSLRLAGALGMPVSVLLGREPAGLNATGESDVRAWYDTIEAERTSVLTPAVERLVHLLLVSNEGPTRGQIPEGWSVDYPPLWQETPMEKANRRKVIADTDAVYLTNGVLTPQEVAASHFGPDGWSDEVFAELGGAAEAPAAGAQQPGDAPDATEPGTAPVGAHSGMGGAGGPTKPAGLLPLPAMNTAGQT